MTGRLPKRSLRLPISGEKSNCIMANTEIKYPPHRLVSFIGMCLSSEMRLGITGIMSPQPITSIVMVTKINPIAAFFEDFIVIK